ncbi:MAG: bifunctional oligoribonuclease/PAP phosphatase NrnA [Candidatus Omnitrophota bacterium]
MSLKKIAAQIRNQNNFLITSHVNMEADALGSELAFYRLVKLLNKNAVIVNEDNLPYGYEFLPGVEVIKKYKDTLKKYLKYDCFVALDCSDLKRTGEVYKLITEGKPVINIDHHISNVNFGTYNWVLPQASSCCEMLYYLYKELGVRFDKDSALALYSGILTDTGSFRFSNTTSHTHKAAAELLEYGLDVVGIYGKLYGNFPYRDMKLVAKIINEARRQHQGKIIWFQVTGEVLKKYKKIYADLTDSVLSFARAIKDTEVAVLFKENLGVKNEVRVNFRSQGKIDVNKIAGHFGGGGHKTASGCTIHARLGQAKSKVLKKIEEALREAGV